MAKSEIRDMTTGSPFRLILGFAVPMLMGLLFQQFYSMVDTIIVGKYLGVSALASVGSTSSINFMIIGFCTGVCSGFSIPVAQRFGAGDHHGLRCFVANAGWLSAIFSAVMTVIVCFLCMDILRWMDTPDDIIQGAYDYIFIIFAGIPVTYLYNILAGIIRSLGDSRTPVYFLLLSSVINIFLDLFTILVMGMGVEGAAYATVISQAISGVLCFLYMRSHFPILRMTREERKFNLRMAKILCGIGVPMGLQYSITAIGSVILQTAVNGLGSLYVAAISAGNKLTLFFTCPFDALGATMATWAGQNVGAGKIDRVKEGVKYALLIGCVYAVAAFVILTLFSKYLALLFLDADEVSTIGNVSLFLFGNSLFYIALVFVNVVRFSIQGMGFSTFAILAGVFEMFARTFAGMCLVPIFGYPAACFASPMAWIAADIFLVPAFLHCIKRLKSASPVI
ncbi:MAG TPA: MATE family efflux transporter [Candidatus Lachnoclostridium stercoripullorum]|uniref:MATE family efflux transporter n=1 Tax=Candidatus Lachnoclostridium stercoripullorum TaxID=2838635 RepID=A0A9D1W3Z5_9FIRM|nr:MATE family efflux transporter [Candidatus Lachnoclostridium stercoripullorum]